MADYILRLSSLVVCGVQSINLYRKRDYHKYIPKRGQNTMTCWERLGTRFRDSADKVLRKYGRA